MANRIRLNGSKSELLPSGKILGHTDFDQSYSTRFSTNHILQFYEKFKQTPAAIFVYILKLRMAITVRHSGTIIVCLSSNYRMFIEVNIIASNIFDQKKSDILFWLLIKVPDK